MANICETDNILTDFCFTSSVAFACLKYVYCMLYFIKLHHVIFCHIMLYCVTLCYIVLYRNNTYHVLCVVLFNFKVLYPPAPPHMTSHCKPSKMLHTCASGTYSTYSTYSTCSTYMLCHAYPLWSYPVLSSYSHNWNRLYIAHYFLYCDDYCSLLNHAPSFITTSLSLTLFSNSSLPRTFPPFHIS